MKKSNLNRLLSMTVMSTMILLFSNLSSAQEPIWDANKIVLVTKKIATNVYGVFPKEAFNDSAQLPKPTSGGFIVGTKSVLVIESFLNATLAKKMISEVRKVTQLPIKFLVNTSYHGDHSYGNYAFPKETMIIQHKSTKDYVQSFFENDKKWMMQNFGKGRGIEEVVQRTGDILIDNNISISLGGSVVEVKTFGFGQTAGDLYVWEAKSKTLWMGNVLVAPEPGIPWLLDGRHQEVLATLIKVRDFLPDDATIIPGHHRPLNKSDMDFSINYVQTLHDGVQKGIDNKQTLEQIVGTLKMDEYNKGYPLWPWLHFQVNIPNTYKDLTTTKK